jgi:hexokinase
MKKSDEFLKDHELRPADYNMQKLVDIFTSEMRDGLAGNPASSLKMIPTYIEADNKFMTGLPVVAIDAGGTNFRAARVMFNADNILEISDVINDRMPGLEDEISKDQFFETIAGYIKPLAENTERIGFCFSYPSEILPSKDGRLIQFCKEVKAPGVIGQLIGKNLLEKLGTPEKQIVILNDTVATLLAGKSASVNKEYDSFIGYILGTGTNGCYIESNRNILSKPDLKTEMSQIINIESGNFGKITQTDIDFALDRTTTNPNQHIFEKMISGGYLGGLCLLTLKTAATEGVFSTATSSGLLSLGNLISGEVSTYLDNPLSGKTPLHSIISDKTDREEAVNLMINIIERASKLVAVSMAAIILKTNKGISPEHPILITVEGTTFYKMHKLREYFEKYLGEYLKGEKQRYYEFTEVKQSSLVGAALAALIN